MQFQLPPIKAWFMIFRILAVVVWAVMTVLLSSAVVFYETGRIDWINFFLVLAIASITQGFPAHIINEIFDWKSGADRYRKIGEKSGGSKVIKSGLATIPQLWVMFVLTSAISFALVIVLYMRTDPRSLWFFGVGYLVCIFYTLPPLSFAYRPFAGEWLGGFAGILLNMTGNYFVQTGTVSPTILVFSMTIGMVYIAIMMLFHYLDYESDRHAIPIKRTTIVFLGLQRSKMYVLILLAASTVLSVVMALQVSVIFTMVTLSNISQFVFQLRCDPSDAESIIKTGKWLTLEMITFAILFSIVVNPIFGWATFPVVLSFYLHKKFGKLRTV
ncbi:prenyltransferase [bacterium]|nr:MAG: prenyltransferase [bacterium]